MASFVRICSVLLALASTAGCAPSQSRPEFAPPAANAAADDATPLLPNVPDIDHAARPDDVYSEHSKGGLRNDSLDRRLQEAANQALERVKPRLQNASPEELIAGLRSYGPHNEVEYYVWRDGNRLIEEELARRGAAARDVLRRHANDERILWTGVSGPYLTVGSLCKRLLYELERANPGGRGGGE